MLTLARRKMFVRVNKLDNIPDDNGGKGGWWTVQPGVPDEGRPGRKAKSKRLRGGEAEGYGYGYGYGYGEGDGEGEGQGEGEGEGFGDVGEGGEGLECGVLRERGELGMGTGWSRGG